MKIADTKCQICNTIILHAFPSTKARKFCSRKCFGVSVSRSNSWKESEDRLLSEEYPKCKDSRLESLCLMLNRTWPQIRNRAYDLGLKRNPDILSHLWGLGGKSQIGKKKKSPRQQADPSIWNEQKGSFEIICNNCNIAFYVKKSSVNRNRMFCSRVCYSAKQKGSIKVNRGNRICKGCKVEFKIPQRKMGKLYCSAKCYHTSKKGTFTHSAESKLKMSMSSKKAGVLKKLHKDPEFQRKRIRGLHSKPNFPEKTLRVILNDLYPGEYEFTGNGKVIIDGLNPDFVNVNGQKKVIEVFGESFHDPKISIKPVPHRATEKGRRKAFAKFGYSMLVIWSKEIISGGDLGVQKLKNKIRKFHENRSH